jgi:hypothetical protein
MYNSCIVNKKAGMKYDQFIYFSVFSSKQQDMIKPFFSPVTERSIFKGVPMERIEEFKQIACIINPGCKIRVRFRGKRIDGMRLTTLKRHAQSVAIYIN